MAYSARYKTPVTRSSKTNFLFLLGEKLSRPLRAFRVFSVKACYGPQF